MKKYADSRFKIINALFVIMTIILCFMAYKNTNSDFSFKFAMVYIIYLVFVSVYNVLYLFNIIRELDN